MPYIIYGVYDLLPIGVIDKFWKQSSRKVMNIPPKKFKKWISSENYNNVQSMSYIIYGVYMLLGVIDYKSSDKFCK